MTSRELLSHPLPKPTGASMARHRSEQEVETPADFIAAVVDRFGPIAFDLAAIAKNAKSDHYFTPRMDGLKQDWSDLEGNLWLNPPFGSIAPWATKCRATTEERHRFSLILMLVPASVGTRWFADSVHQRALVLGLTGRVTFVGSKDPYPKDLMLVVYGTFRGFDTWDWRGHGR